MFVSKQKFNTLCEEYDAIVDDFYMEKEKRIKRNELLKKIHESGHLKNRALMKEIEVLIGE